MQKKIIALAIAAAISAPAFADTSNVTVYGLLNADIESVSNTIPSGTNPTSKIRTTSNASRFGIKGSEDLGDGLSAIWQIETRVNLMGNETTAVAGTTPASTINVGVFNGMRNTNIGLKGNFGTVFLGNWDTPYKVTHNKVELFDNTTIATATALMGANGSATLASGAFNVRENSSVQYWTPVFSGVQGKFAYSAHQSVATTTTQKPSLISMSATYDVDQFYVAYGYEAHTAFTAGANDKDTGSRLVGAYKLDAGQVGLAYENLTTNRAGAAASRAAWELSGKYAMGANNFGAFYTSAGLLNGVANTGATQVSLRYGYNFSKRTEAYALYTVINNNSAANYGFADVANGYTGTAGSKLSGLGMGLVHTF